MPVTPLNRLAQRDQQTFKLSQSQLDETKYAKAAKNVDVLAAKYPSCIEVLTLRGLIYRNIPERKLEGLASIKQAIKLDVRSSVAWHSLGTFHKLEGDYQQALNSFKQSLKSDPLNFQILKDISFLQLHLRQYDRFLETRRFMLSCENDSKINWCMVPFALHMSGRLVEAAETLLKWWSFPREVIGVTSPRWETELRLYLVMLFEEAGQYRRALEHVKCAINYEKDLKNPMAAYMAKGRLELRLGEYDEAKNTYLWLIKALPENTDFLLGYFLCFTEFHPLIPFSDLTINNSLTRKLAPSSLALEGIANPDWDRTPLGLLFQTTQDTTNESSHHQSQPTPASYLDRWSRSRAFDNRLKTAWNRGAFWQLLYAETKIRSSSSNMENCPVTKDLQCSVCEVFDQVATTTLGKPYDSTTAFPLCVLQDENLFRTRLRMVLERKLRRCSPAVFPITDNLLSCSDEKRRIVFSVIEELYETFKAELSKYSEAKQVKSEVINSEVIPTEYSVAEVSLRASLILSLAMADGLKAAYMVRFESSERCGEGLALLDSAIERVPTCVALLDLKVILLTEIGAYEKSAKISKEIYMSDTADRYLNSQSILTQLRAGNIFDAVEIGQSFNKPSPSKPKSEPLDMQNFSYEMSMANSMFKLGLYEQYARRLNLILSRFHTIAEEAQDFYFYSFRRGAFRAVVDFIRANNKLHTYKTYQKAGIKLVDFFLMAYSKSLPPSATSETIQLYEPVQTEPWPITKPTYDYNELLKTPLKTAANLIKQMAGVSSDNKPFLGDFKFNQRTYLAHSRDPSDKETFNMILLIRSIRNLWRLAAKEIHHPKLFPSLAHFLFIIEHLEYVQHFESLPAEEIKELKLEMGIEKYTFSTYLREGVSVLQDSSSSSPSSIKDRIAVLKALADLIWWYNWNENLFSGKLPTDTCQFTELEKLLELTIETLRVDQHHLAQSNSIGDFIHSHEQCELVIYKIMAATKNHQPNTNTHLIVICDSLRSTLQALIKQAFTIRGIQEHLASSHLLA